MIRIGIVGTGSMASERLKAFNDSREAQVTAVYSRTAEKARALCGSPRATPFTDFEQMLGTVDAVVVCTANPTHCDFARVALNAGKPCLVEYPLSTDLAEASAAADLAGGSGCVLMVGNTVIHEKTLQYILEHADKLGKPLSAASRVTFRLPDFRDAWYMQPEVRGPLSPSILYHHAEFFKRIVGFVASSSFYDNSQPDPGRPGYCTHVGGTLLMRHSSGAASATHWYLFGHGEGETRGMWVTGEKQSLSVGLLADRMHEMRWSDGTVDYVSETDWGIAGSCGDFLDAIAGKLDWPKRLDEDLDTLRVALEIPA